MSMSMSMTTTEAMAIVTCTNCGAKNRVEDRGPGVHPVCGRCGESLQGRPAPAKPLDVSDVDFAEKVLEAGARPVLLDCWAAWCGPCRQIAPLIDSLAAEAGDRYLVAKLDIQRNPRTAGMLGIQAIP